MRVTNLTNEVIRKSEMPNSGPLYRLTFGAETLLREHPPRFQHPHKELLFGIAYPPGSAPAGTLEVTRWRAEVIEPIDLAPTLASEVIPNYYDYRPRSDAADCLAWHVNFADPRLFVAYGSRLFAQDEMQVAEHPLLGSVREALVARGHPALTIDDTGPTPVLVSNVERRIEVTTNADAAAGRPYGLYGNRFATAPADVIRRATRVIDPPTMTHLIAMAAPGYGSGEYTANQIEEVFATAFTAFLAARRESHRIAGADATTTIHSGFWGCGAFGGNRHLMIALQALAARAAKIDRLVLHTGDVNGEKDARKGLEVADMLALRCGPECTQSKLVDRCVLLGYRWGVSDGN